jgi:hypothetical protein
MLGQPENVGTVPKLKPGPPECGMKACPWLGIGAPKGANAGRPPLPSRPVTGFQPPDMFMPSIQSGRVSSKGAFADYVREVWLLLIVRLPSVYPASESWFKRCLPMTRNCTLAGWIPRSRGLGRRISRKRTLTKVVPGKKARGRHLLQTVV